MKSQVKLYHSTTEKPFKLMSSKLFIVEDLENYLATFTPLILNDFQYIKDQSMMISIKIIANESNIDLLKANRWKYCSIKNEDADYPRYYFIQNIEWVSQGACVLSLLLDVLNTFRIGRDYSFNARTNILREHKDRFVMPNRNQQTRTFHSAIITDTYISGSPYTPLVFKDGHDFYAGETIEIIPDKPSKIYSFDEYFEEGEGGTAFTKMVLYPNGSTGYLCRLYDGETIIFDGGLNEYTVIYGVFNTPNGLGKYLRGYLTLANHIHRIIDKNSEDINPVLFKQNNDEVIYDKNSVGTSWNLVYINTNSPDPDNLVNPVDCYLVPEERKEIKYGTTLTGRINPLDLEEGVYYYVNEWEIGFDIHTSFANSNGEQIASGSSTKGFVFWRIDANTIGYRITNYDTWNEIVRVVFNVIHQTDYIDVSQPTFRYGRNPNTILTLLTEFPYNYHQNIPAEWYSGNSWEWSTGVLTTTLNAIGEWDKTDAKLIKIIKLPYIPADIPLDEGYLIPTQTFAITTLNGLVCIKLQDLNYKWLNHIDTEQVSPIEKVFNIGDTIFQTEDYESKMYNSEFFIKKYVYDSFALPIIMENVDYTKYKTENPSGVMNINFYTTSTINSRFAFEFVEYTCSRGDNDYYKWLTIARNNEAVLYNVAYINYIRSGFNYDVKNKDLSSTMSWVQFGAGVIGTIGSIIGAVYSGGIAVPMAVGLATTTAMSLANAINTTTKNERDMEQKLNQLKEQSANVRGSDDFDLMYRYNGNKLLLMEYKPSEAMQDLLKKTFYYLGYKCNRYAIPETNTRESFNYLACNPVFNIFSKNLTSEIENQLELLFKSGVTFIHHRVDTWLVIDYGWDLEQTSENLEPDMRDFINKNII